MKIENRFDLKVIGVLISLLYSPLLYALPSGGAVVNGSVNISTSNNVMTIVNTPNAIVNWNQFNIGKDELVRIQQNSSTSAMLNRIIGGNPTEILGALQSNGRVFIINPSGILFGAGSRVDVGGLVASTLNISDKDFLAGNHHFTDGLSGGAILNEGVLSSGGYIALIAKDIYNTGIITSPNGQIILASGHEVNLIDLGNPLMSVSVLSGKDVNLTDLIVKAGGNIFKAGFSIVNSGKLDTNQLQRGLDGKISIKSINAISTTDTSVISSDRIILKADNVGIYSGLLSTSAGGFLETSGGFLDVSGAKLNLGKGSTWSLDPYDICIASNPGLCGLSTPAYDTTTLGTLYAGGDSIVSLTSFIDSTTISTVLSGANVKIETTSPNINALDSLANPVALGNINIYSSITGNSVSTLSLLADNNIILNSNASLNNVNLDLKAGGIIDMKTNGSVESNSNQSIVYASGGSSLFNLVGNGVDSVFSMAGSSSGGINIVVAGGSLDVVNNLMGFYAGVKSGITDLSGQAFFNISGDVTLSGSTIHTRDGVIIGANNFSQNAISGSGSSIVVDSGDIYIDSAFAINIRDLGTGEKSNMAATNIWLNSTNFNYELDGSANILGNPFTVSNRWLVSSSNPFTDSGGQKDNANLMSGFHYFGTARNSDVLGVGNGFYYSVIPSFDVSFVDATKVYGVNDPLMQSSVVSPQSYLDLFGDTFASTGYSLGRATGEDWNGGNPYLYTVNGLSSHNYGLNLLTPSAGLTVTQAPLVVTTGNGTKQYGLDVANNVIGYTTVGLVDNASLGINDLSLIQNVISDSLGMPVAAGVGSYDNTPISVVSSSPMDNYAITYVSGVLTVEPAPIVLMGQDQTIMYGNSFDSSAWSLINGSLYNGDVLSGSIVNNAPSVHVGLYNGVINQGTLTDINNPNYAITYVDGLLEIIPANLLINVNPVVVTYGNENYNLSYTVSGLVAGDVMQGSLDNLMPSQASAGIYAGAIQQGTLSAVNQNDYNVGFTAPDIQVNRADLMVVVNSQTIALGGQINTAGYTVSGLQYSDFVSGGLDSTLGVIPTNLGSGFLTQGFVDVGNVGDYNLIFSGGVLDVVTSIAPPSGVVPNMKLMNISLLALGGNSSLGNDVYRLPSQFCMYDYEEPSAPIGKEFKNSKKDLLWKSKSISGSCRY